MKHNIPTSTIKLNKFLLMQSLDVPAFPDDFKPFDESQYPNLTDEQLLALHQNGVTNALAELEVRYYMKRIVSAHMVMPNIHDKLDESSISEAFFTAIYSSVRNFNWKAKFVTFFHCVFRNELIREINNSSRCFTLCNYVSLDSTVDNEDRPICESISSKEDNLDPVNYASYRLLLEDLKHLPPSFDAMSAKVVALLLKGFRAHEIAGILHLTDYRVRYIISNVRDYVRQKYGFVPDK